MEKKPRIASGEVSREFVYELVEAAVAALAGQPRSVEQAVNNFRIEVQDRYTIEKAPDPMDE